MMINDTSSVIGSNYASVSSSRKLDRPVTVVIGSTYNGLLATGLPELNDLFTELNWQAHGIVGAVDDG